MGQKNGTKKRPKIFLAIVIPSYLNTAIKTSGKN